MFWILECGNVLTVGSTEAPAADCSNGSDCAGDKTQKCGAEDRLDLYRITSAPKEPLPNIVLKEGSFVSQGCFK